MAEEVKQAQGECGQEGCEAPAEGKKGHCGNKNLEGVKPSDQAKTLKDMVAESIAASGPEVRQMVMKHLVDDELKKRTDLVLKGLAKKDELEKELRKIKPDNKTAGFDHTGKQVVEPVFTEEQVKTLKQLREQLTKVENALEKALADKPCFDKLKEVCK